jgi:propionate CoA-transferase
LARGQRVLYVTERAVLELTPQGLRLNEVAAGVDIAKDILPWMGFTPIMDPPPVLMPHSCFDPS